MAPPRLIRPAVLPAVSYAEMSQYRRDEDLDVLDVLNLMAAAATRHIEQWCGRAIMPQGWEMVLDGFPSGIITLPVGPVSVVDEVRYVDAAGADQVLAPDQYRVDVSRGEARLEPVTAWPATAAQIGAVTVEWTAGADECPPDLKVAILLHAGHLYENREAVVVGPQGSELPLGVRDMVAPYRRFMG